MPFYHGQELKEMKTLAQNKIKFVCKPCKFESEALIESTKHVSENEAHKTIVETYCHPCDKSFADKGMLEQHRSSFDHQKKIHARLAKIYNVSVHPEQDLKEMKIIVENKTQFVCKPCEFESDVMTECRKHVYEDEEHIKAIANYCHVCTRTFTAKGKLEEHRFSIVHKNKLRNKLSSSDIKKKRSKVKKVRRSKRKRDTKPVVNMDQCEAKAQEVSELNHTELIAQAQNSSNIAQKDVVLEIMFKNNIFRTFSTEETYCNICDFVVKTHSKSSIYRHLISQKHRDKLKKRGMK